MVGRLSAAGRRVKPVVGVGAGGRGHVSRVHGRSPLRGTAHARATMRHVFAPHESSGLCVKGPPKKGRRYRPWPDSPRESSAMFSSTCQGKLLLVRATLPDICHSMQVAPATRAHRGRTDRARRISRHLPQFHHQLTHRKWSAACAIFARSRMISAQAVHCPSHQPWRANTSEHLNSWMPSTRHPLILQAGLHGDGNRCSVRSNGWVCAVERPRALIGLPPAGHCRPEEIAPAPSMGHTTFRIAAPPVVAHRRPVSNPPAVCVSGAARRCRGRTSIPAQRKGSCHGAADPYRRIMLSPALRRSALQCLP
jgi:hypothetical protein